MQQIDWKNLGESAVPLIIGILANLYQSKPDLVWVGLALSVLTAAWNFYTTHRAKTEQPAIPPAQETSHIEQK